jgi:hypothetical protein
MMLRHFVFATAGLTTSLSSLPTPGLSESGSLLVLGIVFLAAAAYTRRRFANSPR